MTHGADLLVALSASTSLLGEGDWTPGPLVPPHSLLFHGSSDKVVPYVEMQEVVRILHGSEVVAVTLDNEGHFYNRSLEIVCERLRSFIRAVEEQVMGGKQT